MEVLRLLSIVAFFYQANCAKILCIIPVASYSHQIPLQPLWRELSIRGHQITLITTNPMKDPSLTNLTEIDISYTYEIYDKHNFSDLFSEDVGGMERIKAITVMLNEAGNYQFAHPDVQNLIHNKEIHFDLIILEAQLPGMMAFSWRFNCPMIGITTLDSAIQYHLAMGNPAHPVANPDINLPIHSEELGFKERLGSLLYSIFYTFTLYYKLYPELHVKLKKIFGDGVSDPLTLHDNMVMLFINTHPIFQDIRPLGPSTVPIGGGIHLKKPQPLPENIKKYLDNAKEGVIYFSLGTNVNSRMLKKVMPAVLAALGEVPYKVLLKIDLNLENVPENVEIHKWLPQQDILRHPNVKLFITQGGLQSLQEAVYNAVPTIGIPFLGDQIANVNKMKKMGYGLKLNKNDVTKESLKEAVLQVINDPKYRERAQELSSIYRDEEIPSLQRAVWWTEFVIRHKGARHLRNPVIDMPNWKYFMLDIIGFCLAVLFFLIFVLYNAIKFILRLCLRRNSSKLKVQ